MGVAAATFLLWSTVGTRVFPQARFGLAGKDCLLLLWVGMSAGTASPPRLSPQSPRLPIRTLSTGAGSVCRHRHL